MKGNSLEIMGKWLDQSWRQQFTWNKIVSKHHTVDFMCILHLLYFSPHLLITKSERVQNRIGCNPVVMMSLSTTFAHRLVFMLLILLQDQDRLRGQWPVIHHSTVCWGGKAVGYQCYETLAWTQISLGCIANSDGSVDHSICRAPCRAPCRAQLCTMTPSPIYNSQ
jgi:hypothetical protein